MAEGGSHRSEENRCLQRQEFPEEIGFDELFLSRRILTGISKAGFKKPSPLQVEAILAGQFDKDVIIIGRSGAGKTVAASILALEVVKYDVYRPQVMILAPTREIAAQILSVIKSLSSGFQKLACHCFVGGTPLYLDKGLSVTTQVIVGTPGRIKHLISLKCLQTSKIKLLVFDEADELFSSSFDEEVQYIFNSLPEDKQVIATSAIYPKRLAEVVDIYFRPPHVVKWNPSERPLSGIVHYAKVVEYPIPKPIYNMKLGVLKVILNSVQFSQCLVFCNGVERVETLHNQIEEWGFSTTYLSSALEHIDRLEAISKLKNFECEVLVSSDLASRGIDTENVDLVINFDFPVYRKYIHRVECAGRYGSVGVAVTIVSEDKVEELVDVAETASVRIYLLPDPVPLDLISNPCYDEFLKSEPPALINIFGSDSLEDSSVYSLEDSSEYVLEDSSGHSLEDSSESVLEDSSRYNLEDLCSSCAFEVQNIRARCFLPSSHRCLRPMPPHRRLPPMPPNRCLPPMPTSFQFDPLGHRMFYDQWQYLQNVVYGGRARMSYY